MRSVFFYNPRERSRERDGPWAWRVKVWLPVLLALGVIATESTNTFSAKNTSGWLRPLAENFVGRINDLDWEAFHHYLRKTGHFLGYGTVGFTFLRAWLHTLGERGPSSLLSWRLEASILAIMSTALVATCDEVHQTFLPDRTGTPVDVLLDTCGALTMCVLVWLICWVGRTRAAVEED